MKKASEKIVTNHFKDDQTKTSRCWQSVNDIEIFEKLRVSKNISVPDDLAILNNQST